MEANLNALLPALILRIVVGAAFQSIVLGASRGGEVKVGVERTWRMG
jgi:hypothetical protein